VHVVDGLTGLPQPVLTHEPPTPWQTGDASEGAFHPWRVLLCVKPAVRAGFKRLLEAGGATVVRDT